MIDLSGKNALVTGGTRGVGLATSRLLAQAGAAVGMGYRSRSADAETAVAELTATGATAWAHGADLGTPEGAASLFGAADEAFDGLDLFIGNAGIWPPVSIDVAEMTDEQWRGTMTANLDSMFYTCREAARRMRDGGSIVLVGSTAGQRGEAGHADYAATKGAMMSFVKGFCVELAPRDVNVNCVAPGWIDTEMAASAYVGSERDRINASIPIGRIATAEDVAGPIVFLCSPLARHITGEVLNVNGGAVLAG